MSQALVDVHADHEIDAEELWRAAGEGARDRAGQLRAVARNLARLVLERKVSLAKARELWLGAFERVAMREMAAHAAAAAGTADAGAEAVSKAVVLGGARGAPKVTRADRERRRAARGAQA